jgi:hypothetical protein
MYLLDFFQWSVNTDEFPRALSCLCRDTGPLLAASQTGHWSLYIVGVTKQSLASLGEVKTELPKFYMSGEREVSYLI